LLGILALRFAKGGSASPKTMPKPLAEGARFLRIARQGLLYEI
jgi:hypothetical protein